MDHTNAIFLPPSQVFHCQYPPIQSIVGEGSLPGYPKGSPSGIIF